MSPDSLPPPKSPDEGDGGKKAGNPYALIGMGFELAFIVAVLALGGRWLDGRFASSPWLSVLGLVLGIAGGFYRFWQRVMSKDD